MQRGLAVGLAGVLGLACGDDAGDTPRGQREQSIIRGRLLQSAALDHTGALVIVEPDTPEPSVFCTATLIGPETLVTAKHCALALLEADRLGLQMEWLTGPSTAEAVERIAVAAIALAPVHVGGFLGIGRDVAVAHLAHPARSPFAQPAQLTDEHVGEGMLSIGYGVFTPGGAQDGRRRVGNEAVAALRGRTFEAMFGSFENFVEWSLTGDISSANFLAGVAGNPLFSLLLPGLRGEYEAAQLLDGYEAVTGRSLGDTQTCSGDSGGPLAQLEPDGSWRTYGVVSGGLYSARSVCDFGSVFAVFGPETLEFLEDAQRWTDPCGDVPPLGECQGGRAVRCQTSLFNDVRRPIQRDCAAAGLTCGVGTEGADCFEPAPDAGSSSADGGSTAPPDGADAGAAATPDGSAAPGTAATQGGDAGG